MYSDNVLQTAREFNEVVPSRSPEVLSDYIKQARLVQSDLKSYLGGPHRLVKGASTADYTEANGLLQEIGNKVPMAEMLLDRVRAETPQDTVIASGDEGEIDWEKTVTTLAVRTAQETVGLPKWDRLYAAEESYRTHIDPKIPEGLRDFPKARYDAKVTELIEMDPSQLKEAVEREFPTDEWIGKEPASPVDHQDSRYEHNVEADPNTEDGVDNQFENNIDAEKRHRGITAKVAKDKYDDGGDAKATGTDGTKSKDDNLFKKKQDSEKVQDEAGNDTDEKEEKEKKDTERKPKASLDNLYDLARQYDSKEAFKQAVENRSGVSIVSEPSNPDHPEDTFESNFEEGTNQSQGEPRGPNRRKSEDVPAYSTPRDKLTAAVRELTAAYDVDNDTANDIVRRVVASFRRK